jgi:acetolactate synthase-1/2/3 large subunit
MADASASVAVAIAAALADAGVRLLFGVPGGGNNLELIGAAERHGLRFVLTHTETAAALMAAVSGELTGVPGACVATRGPGAASAVNGVAHALLDRAPMVVVTDGVPEVDFARVSHQRLDQQALFGAVTKWSARIGVDGAAETAAHALRVAYAGTPGPVHLDFVPDAPAPELLPIEAPAPPDPGAVERARAHLSASRRPVFAIGLGARRASADLVGLLRGSGHPILTTYKAKGVVPESWPETSGLLTGATIESPVLVGADLIVAVGLDPIEFIPGPWPYPAPVLALSEWPLDDPYYEPAVELVGPLPELIGVVGGVIARSEAGAAAVDARAVDAAHVVQVPGLAPHEVVQLARERAPGGTIATVDSGAHMLVTMPFWKVDEPFEVLTSSGLATMGFALPAAIAAALERPARHVVCFVGDGGLALVLGELETLARLALPVVVVVFDDSALSLIEIKQAPGQGGRGAVRYAETDFAAAARACGVAAERVSSRDELARVVSTAFSEPRPFLIDATIDASGYPSVLAAVRGGSRET